METKVYPRCCTSMYCGKSSGACPSCPNFPALKAHEEWVVKHNAIVTDKIWNPLIYTATQ